MLNYLTHIELIVAIVALTLAESYYNSWLIEKKKVDPHKWDSWVRRGLVYLVLVILSGHNYVFMSIPLMFWWLFDTSLNVFRGEKLTYVGNVHFFDKFQYGFEGPAFFFKFILFLAGLFQIITDNTGYF